MSHDGDVHFRLAASFCFHVPWAGCGQDLMCKVAVQAIKVPARQGYMPASGAPG